MFPGEFAEKVGTRAKKIKGVEEGEGREEKEKMFERLSCSLF